MSYDPVLEPARKPTEAISSATDPKAVLSIQISPFILSLSKEIGKQAMPEPSPKSPRTHHNKSYVTIPKGVDEAPHILRPRPGDQAPTLASPFFLPDGLWDSGWLSFSS